MEKFATGLYNLVNTWIPLVWILMAIVLVAVGVGCMIPSEEMKAKCKKALPWVAIGAGIVVCATSIAKEIAGAWAF